MTVFPSGIPFSHITVDHEMIRQLKYVDTAHPLTNTFYLFLKAHLPYLDYYLSSVDFLEIPPHAETSLPERLAQILKERLDTTFCITEGVNDDPVTAYLEQASITAPLFVSYEDRQLPSGLFDHNRNLRKARHIKIQDKHFQIEPLWHSLRKELERSTGFDCVLLSLGWEKVPLANRLCQFYRVPVLDVGRYAMVQDPSLTARLRRRLSAALQQFTGSR